MCQMSYRGYSNIEVYMTLEALAKELGKVQLLPDVLHCSSCYEPLYLVNSIHRVVISHKRAIHKPVHTDGSAVAFICDKCHDSKKEPLIVLHLERSGRQRVIELNIDDLPDI